MDRKFVRVTAYLNLGVVVTLYAGHFLDLAVDPEAEQPGAAAVIVSTASDTGIIVEQVTGAEIRLPPRSGWVQQYDEDDD